MKIASIWILVTSLLLLAGCGSIDTTPPGNPDRVLKGAVNYDGMLPIGAEVVVRLLETDRSESALKPAGDLPVAAVAAPVQSERVLGETRVVVPAMTRQPLPFQIEYFAEDPVLRRGLTVDVRISVGGKVRYRTINAHVVSLASAPFKQDVWVQGVQ